MHAALPTVKRQSAAVRVDTAAARWSGHTELHVVPPQAAPAGAQSMGFHCYGLRVTSVTVNGQPATFKLQEPVREELPDAVVAAAYESAQHATAAVAEAALYLYERQLQRERLPELSITLPPAAGGGSGGGGGGGPGAAGEPELLAVRVEFEGGGQGAAGLQFWQAFAATDAQVRRASAWLPCVDAPAAAVRWEGLDVTCRADQVAVGPGRLQRQSWADGGRRWRTFHYELPLPVPPCQLGFAVGPFRMAATALPAPRADAAAAASSSGGPQDATQLTHFAPQRPPAELAVAAVLATAPSVAGEKPGASNGSAASDGLARSAHFTGLVWSFFEELLGCRCPLPALQQAFLPPELQLGSAPQVGAGLQLLSAAHVVQPRAIEQSIAARCAMARTLARQWFGVLLRAATPLDEWLVEGLCGWLEEQYVRRYMGRNELAYRRWRERRAIFLADNGEAPPLAARGLSVPSPWGPLYGTERLEPSQLWSAKATAVVALLEKRAGEELFSKHVATVVQGAVAALAAELGGTAGAGAATGADGTPAPTPGKAAGTASGGAAPGPTPQKEGGGGEGGAGAAAPGSRQLDTMAFLNDLGRRRRAGSFRREMAPFAARWVYGRGVPHVTAAFIYHSRLACLELALRQAGGEAAKRAADVAQRAAGEGSNVGIIKAVVREGEGYTDHPVHLGGEAFVLAELKVTPPVEKKVAGRRSAKQRAQDEAAAALAEDPVRWVRLDPGGELLADIRLLQPERMLVNQLLHSADVVAQAEAIQRLGELRLEGGGLEALRRTLADRKAFYRVRCDAALALAGLRDGEGGPAGLPSLLDFYRSHYFLAAEDGGERTTPACVAVSDPSEYFVAQAVVTAVSLCREADGTTPVDVLLFLSTILQDYSAAPGAPYSDYGLVAAMCGALGNLHYPGFGDTLLALLEKFLERDAVLVSPASAVGSSCLLAMAALCANGTCEGEEAARVVSAVRRVRLSPGLPVPLRHAALAAALQVAAAQGGPASALALALAGVPEAAAASSQEAAGQVQVASLGGLPSLSTPAFLLEEAVQLVAAASAAAAPSSAAAAAFAAQPASNGSAGAALGMPLPLLRRLAGLLSAGGGVRQRHLAFTLLQLLAGQPPTLYRPPPGEDVEDAAAFLTAAGAAVPAPSHGATHRTGQQASGAAAPAPKIVRLQLGGGGGGAKSAAISGDSGPAISGQGPAASDARALSHGAVEQVPPAARGQLFSPVRAAGTAGPFADEASSRQAAAAAQAQAAAAVAQAPAPLSAAAQAVAAFRLKVAAGAAAKRKTPEPAAAAPPAQQQQQQRQQQQPTAAEVLPASLFASGPTAHLAAPAAAPLAAAPPADWFAAQPAAAPVAAAAPLAAAPAAAAPAPGPPALKKIKLKFKMPGGGQ